MSNVVKRVKIGKDVDSNHPMLRMIRDQKLILKTIREGRSLSELKDIKFAQPL